MSIQEEIKDTLANAQYIALASVHGDSPNIRILDVIFDRDTNKILFIAHKMSPKTAEFKEQNKVAFTTLPPMGPGMTIRCDAATVVESTADIEAVKDQIVQRHPQIENMFNAFAENAQLFELSFDEVRAFAHGKESTVSL